MPSLEALKKQAKLYLRWHRNGHYTGRRPDQGGPAPFRRALRPRDPRRTLSSVRRPGARRADAGLRELAGAEGRNQDHADRTRDRLPTQATLIAAEPQLLVSDIAATCDYFVERLGFQVRVHLWRARLLRTGGARRRPPEPALGERARSSRRASGSARARCCRFDHGRRHQPPVRRIRTPRRHYSPAAADRALGRPHLHCRGSRLQPDPLRVGAPRVGNGSRRTRRREPQSSPRRRPGPSTLSKDSLPKAGSRPSPG